MRLKTAAVLCGKMRGDKNMNKNSLKQYMKQERELRKKNSDLQIMLFGFFMFFLLMFTCIFAFADGGEGGVYGIIFPYFMMENLAFKFLCEPIYSVKEKNKLQSVFTKMLYVPRNMKDILAAKALVMIRDMGIVVIITQLLTVLINIPYNGGRFVVYAETFAPLYSGVVCMLIELIVLWSSYREAVKER